MGCWKQLVSYQFFLRETILTAQEQNTSPAKAVKTYYIYSLYSTGFISNLRVLLEGNGGTSFQ